MLSEASLRYPLETGGILIGYFMESNVVIVDAIGPGKSASHALGTFTPDYSWQDKEVAQLYKKSGRRHTYLGDWHTHPDGSGSLSMKDISTLENIATCKTARVSSPVMAILSGTNEWEITIWNYYATNTEKILVAEIHEIHIYGNDQVRL